MFTCDVFERAVLVAAGNDVKMASTIKGCIVKVNEAIGQNLDHRAGKTDSPDAWGTRVPNSGGLPCKIVWCH